MVDQANNKRVGIYSGVFDPIHHGHLGLAQASLDLGLVDKVYVMVEEQPRRKSRVSRYRDRLNMAWLATHEHPKIELLVLDEPQFSIRYTLPELEKKFGPVSLLMGSDLATYLHTWPDYEVLKGRTRLIIGEREGSPIPNLPIENVVITTKRPQLSATQIRGSDPVNHSKFMPRTVAQYISVNNLYAA